MLVTGVAVDSTGQRTTVTLDVGVSGQGGNWWDQPADQSNTGWRNAPGAPPTLPDFEGTISDGQTIRFAQFPTLTRIQASGVTFVGCRFHGAQPDGANTILQGDDLTFEYCTWEPDLPWSPDVPDDYVTFDQSYQYGLAASGEYGSHTAGLTMRYCDFWGFGNAVTLKGSGPFLFDRCWFHDPCINPAHSYHVDAIGYLNGIDGEGISNLTVQDSTIETAGKTNGIALQKGVYDNIKLIRSYFGGFGFTVCVWRGATNVTVTDNVLSTEYDCQWGPLYGTDFMDRAGSTWARNRWHSKDPATGGNMGWGSAEHDGWFWAYTPGLSPAYPPPQNDDTPFVSLTDYSG